MVFAQSGISLSTPSVSSKQLMKARRSAKRKRSAAACPSCKSLKAKCSDYRPCGRCLLKRIQTTCIDEENRVYKVEAHCIRSEQFELYLTLALSAGSIADNSDNYRHWLQPR